jgi:hypothetical protein
VLDELIVLFEFLHPSAHLPDPGSGDDGHEPAELVLVESAQIVGVVRGLALMEEPIQ